jgi:O-antigen/teichoic acid export membrane protein
MRGSSAFLAYVIFAFIARHSSAVEYGRFAFVFTLTGFLGPLSALGQESVAFKYVPPFRTHFRWLAVLNGYYLLIGISVFSVVGVIALMHSFGTVSAPMLFAIGGLVAASGLSEYLFAVQRGFGSLYQAIFSKELLWRLVFMGLLSLLWIARPTEAFQTTELSYFYLTALLASLLVSGRFFFTRWATAPLPALPAPFTVTRVQVGVFFTLTFLTVAAVHVDTLVLGLATNGANLGAYFSAQRTMQVLMFFSYSFSMVAAPAVAIAAAKRDFHEMAVLSRRMSRYSSVCVALVAVIFIVEAPTILGIFNPEFRVHADILRILCIGPLVSSVCGMHYWIPTLCGLENEYLKWRLSVLALFSCLKLAVALWGGIEVFACLSAAEMSAVALTGVFLARTRFGIWTF